MVQNYMHDAHIYKIQTRIFEKIKSNLFDFYDMVH